MLIDRFREAYKNRLPAPVCYKCKKPVDGLKIIENDSSFSKTFVIECHGEVLEFEVSDHDLQSGAITGLAEVFRDG